MYEERIKILRTASQLLTVLYLIIGVFILTALNDSVLERAQSELRLLQTIDDSFNVDSLSISQPYSLNLSSRSQAETASLMIKRFANIFGDIEYISGGEFIESSNFNRLNVTGANIRFRDREPVEIRYNSGDFKIELDLTTKRELKNIQDWRNFFETGMAINTDYPDSEFFFNYYNTKLLTDNIDTLLILNDSDTVIIDSWRDLNLHEIKSFEYEKYYPFKCNEKLCPEAFTIRIQLDSKFEYNGETPIDLNHQIYLTGQIHYKNSTKLETRLLAKDYIFHLRSLEMYANEIPHSSIYLESLTELGGINSFYAEISNLDLKDLEEYLKTEISKNAQIEFAGVSISNKFFSILIPFIILLLLVYHYLHIKKIGQIDSSENYYPWIPLQVGLLEDLYTVIFYLIIPLAVQIYFATNSKTELVQPVFSALFIYVIVIVSIALIKNIFRIKGSNTIGLLKSILLIG